MASDLEYLVNLVHRAKTFAPIIAKNALLSAFEPRLEKLSIRPANVGAITRTIRDAGHDQFMELRQPKGRNDFLCAAYKHLRNLDHEELFVALGRRRGSKRNAGSQLSHIWRGVGTKTEVEFTPAICHAIDNAMKQKRGSILIIHNHPPYDLKTMLSLILGWIPLPSPRDRAVASYYNLKSFVNRLKGTGSPALRWYLVDDGELAEFFLPPAEIFERILQEILASVAPKEISV